MGVLHEALLVVPHELEDLRHSPAPDVALHLLRGGVVGHCGAERERGGGGGGRQQSGVRT